MGRAVRRECAPGLLGRMDDGGGQVHPRGAAGRSRGATVDSFRAGLAPAAGDEVFLFEFRLDEPEPAADLSLWAVPHRSFAEYLVERGEADGASSTSRGLARYLVETGREDSFLARWLAYAMLEYDLADGADGAGEAPTPGVFLGSRFDNPANRPTHGFVRWRHGNPGVMTAAICQAVGWEENDRERRHVQTLCDLLPQSAYSAQVGAMPGRESRAIRLVARLPAATCRTI